VTERDTFRLAGPVIFWWIWVAFVALNLVDDAVQGFPAPHTSAVIYAVLLFVTGLAYTLALRPRVRASGDGITVLNPYRTHRVPWRLVTAVDTGEWVQVHVAPGPSPEPAAESVVSSAGDKTVHCWGLYVSSRARRKIASGPPRPQSRRGLFSLPGFGGGGAGALGGNPQTASARLPEEARYLASLPLAKAMAVRLDSRATRERARAANSDTPDPASSSWSWLALAAVIAPAAILLAAILA
jgi:Bacterial PH domain